MKQTLQITDFASKGLNTDLQPWDLPPGFLTAIKNFRIANLQLTPFGGNQLVVDLPVDFIPGLLMYANTKGGPYWLVAGQDGVFAYDYSSLTDISNALGYPVSMDESKWQGTVLSGIPILNNIDTYPEYWPVQNTANKLIQLPWDSTNTWEDVNQRAAIVRSHKQFLFALDLVDNGIAISDGVRWSAPADIGGVPPTWDHLDTTNVAGLTSLGSNGGEIVDGKSLKDSFVVYRRNAISIFDYVGGVYVWRIRQLSDNTGATSKDAIEEVNGVHYFIGDGDIYVNNGSKVESILHNRLRKQFRGNINTDAFSKSYTIRNESANEIWFCIPSAGSSYPDLAYLYNWIDQTWSIIDIPSSVSGDYGVRLSDKVTWENIGLEWDDSNRPWGERSVTPGSEIVMCATPPMTTGGSGKLLVLDNFTTGAISSFDSIFERVSLALEGIAKTTTISRLYPHIKGPGSVYIQLGSQDYPGDTISWKPRELFDPSIDRSITTRSTGELHSFRFESVDGTPWFMSGIVIEYTGAGTR